MDLNSTLQQNKLAEYLPYKDWKLVSIVQFGKIKINKVNLFKNVLALETCSSIDLEVKKTKYRIVSNILN